MARGSCKIVSVNGALTVTFTTAAGGTPTVFSDVACTTPISLPATVADGANTTFYFASPGAYTVSVKTGGGTEIAGDANTTRVISVFTGDVAVLTYDARLLANIAGDTGRSPATATGGGGGTTLPANASGVLENNGSGTLTWTAKTAAVAAAFGWVIATDPAYGAKGDGTTDDTTALQAAINATPTGGCLFIPALLYKTTATLVINKAMTIRGGGMSVVYGSQATGTSTDAQNLPMAAPFLKGAVLNMRTAATDAVSITVTGAAVNIYDLGVLFGASGDAVILQNTGHGFVGLPPVLSATRDMGMMGANWHNVAVYGHDGNHYAYRFTNVEYSTFTQIEAFGGGGWYEDTIASYDASPGGFGNNVFVNPYFVVCCPGTAHGVERGPTQPILLEAWYRPQIWMYVVLNATIAGISKTIISGPTTSQRVWKDDTSGLGSTVDSPDFETSVVGGSQFTTGGFCVTGNWYFGDQVTPVGGSSINLPGGVTATLTTAGAIGANTIKEFSVPGAISGYHSQAATVSNQAALGTSPPANVPNSCTSVRGNVTFGTGTATAAGDLVEIGISTYAAGAGGAIPVVTPTNAATVGLGLYVKQINQLFFRVCCATAPAASQANTTYGFAYHVIA